MGHKLKRYDEAWIEALQEELDRREQRRRGENDELG
jgi:hypothetical protein